MVRRELIGAEIIEMTQQPPPDGEESEHERRMTNIGLLVAAVLIIGGGIWLVNALVDARKAEMCLESGRRNCNPINIERKAE